ncbi:hypothetical protein [Sphingomonas sp. MMS24-J13]|uniref:hypothetical protein n=1 Tax=Sphingomonas sp. MMS24-J13 TaxID=3238686 RepID=UPI0038503FE1
MTIADNHAPQASGAVASDIETRRLVTAKAWKRAGELPGKFFDDPMLFVNPALNILLDLYISFRENREVNVSSACIASGAPATTALRYITRLLHLGLVQKTDDKKDLRVCYVDLTVTGKVRMEQSLDAAVDSDKRLGLARLRFEK